MDKKMAIAMAKKQSDENSTKVWACRWPDNSWRLLNWPGGYEAVGFSHGVQI